MRTLLLMVLGASTVFGRISWNAHVNRTQQQHFRAIWKLGGGIGFEEGQFLSMPLGKEWPAEPRRNWFDEVFGRQTPNYVLFAARNEAEKIDDGDLDALIALLGRLPSVKLVQLQGSAVSAHGVDRLRSALPRCHIQRTAKLRTKPGMLLNGSTESR